jgi:anti-sigma B factor antagonist
MSYHREIGRPKPVPRGSSAGQSKSLPDDRASSEPSPGSRPSLRVQSVHGVAIVEFVNAQNLYEDAVIRELGTQLRALVEQGNTRLLLNLAGSRSMSSDLLGMLASLQRRLEKANGRLGLCGLDPALRDMIRICRLDRFFEILPDAAECSPSGPRQ